MAERFVIVQTTYRMSSLGAPQCGEITDDGDWVEHDLGDAQVVGARASGLGEDVMLILHTAQTDDELRRIPGVADYDAQFTRGALVRELTDAEIEALPDGGYADDDGEDSWWNTAYESWRR